MNNIVLIGFMGSGKSSVGKHLSYLLQRELIDTDSYIERQYGQSVSEIFAKKGEAFFREAETACLRNLCLLKRPHIIAVGGGTPLQEKNRDLLHRLGHVVYLKATPEVIFRRLQTDTTRPLLQGEHPQERIEALLRDRTGVYEETADIIVDVSEQGFDQILEEIQKKVEQL